MDIPLLRVHQRQVAHQCRAAIMAFDLAQQALNPPEPELFFINIQNALSATANISKALWGQSGQLADQRRSLRESLGVEDDGPLASTDLRNHLDHYDERLDRWYQTSQHHNYVDFNIGVTIAGVEQTDMFRNFDPTTGEVTFWGERYSMPRLYKALTDLLPAATKEAAGPHW